MIPAGVTTATVHLDAPVSFTGDPGRIHIVIVPSVPLVWTATGTPMGNFIDTISLNPGKDLDIALPHTDQPGFEDGFGNAYTDWFYTVTVVYEKDGQRIDFPAKDFQVLSGQTTVDLALVPAGEAAPVPMIAPIQPVTSIDGFNGAVTLADLQLELVDNTADAQKPVSGPQQTALNLKLDITTANTALAGKLDTIASTFYVDFATGNDANSGRSWKLAKKTIQAAVTAAAEGDEIILAPGGHDVGAGVTCDDSGKGLTIRGDHSLRRRQHADRWSRQTHIYSTAATKPTYFFRIGTATSSNTYGWTFKNLYFDADTLAVDGALLQTYGVNRAIVEDVSGRSLDTTVGTRWVVKAEKGTGDDASWWTLRNVITNGVALAYATSANYWTFPGCSAMGSTDYVKPAGPAVYIKGSQPNFNGLHVEGWVKGIMAEASRGVQAVGIAGEWVTTMVHLKDCYDSLVIQSSRAGAGNSDILDENGRNNIVIGGYHRKSGTTYQSFGLSSYGMSPTQLAGDYIAPLYGFNPGLPLAGSEVMHNAGFDGHDIFASVGFSAIEYWDGAAWVAWAGVDTNVLHLSNEQVLTIDATHKRFRITATNTFDHSQGLLIGRLAQTQGTQGTITVRCIKTDGSVAQQNVLPYVSPGNLKGFQTTTWTGCVTVQVEFDLGLTGAQTAQLKRLHLYSPDLHANLRGRFMRSRVLPEGVVNGYPGDLVQVLGSSPTASLWQKMTGSGNTGWGRVVLASPTGDIEFTAATAGVIFKSTNGTRYRLTVGDDGALTTTAL